jgi:hypothetical protein
MDKLALLDQLSKLETLRSSLHSSFRFWEWMVVVGLGFDLLVILKEYWDDLKDFWRREIHPPEKPSFVLLVLAVVGTGLILYGISKELSIDSKLEKVETDTREVNNKLFGMVSDAVTAVDVKTDKINEGVKAANQLLDMLGPRSWLLEKNRASFVKDLSPRAGQRIIIVSCRMSGPDAAEQDELRKDLIAFLGSKGAGWAVEPQEATWDECQFPMLSKPEGVGGIVLVLNMTHDAKAKDSVTVSAQKLKDALNNIKVKTSRAGIERVFSNQDNSELGSFWKSVNDHPEAIYLLVGNNALFTLTNSQAK